MRQGGVFSRAGGQISFLRNSLMFLLMPLKKAAGMLSKDSKSPPPILQLLPKSGAKTPSISPSAPKHSNHSALLVLTSILAAPIKMSTAPVVAPP